MVWVMSQSTLSPESVKAIAWYVRRMLAPVKRRPATTGELALAVAAARIVSASLERAARDAGLPADVWRAIDDVAAEASSVMALVRWT